MKALSLLSPRQLAIDGIAVTNPADNQRIARVKSYNAEDTKLAVQLAHNEMATWAELTAKQRAAILQKWFTLIMQNQHELAQLMTAECGKPLHESMGEVVYGASFVEWFAEEGKRIYGDIIPTHKQGIHIHVIKQPIGVTAAITPWNFPLAMITRKAAPALAAGCPMLVKPAEATPLTALALEQLAHQAGIPPNIFRVLPTHEPKLMGQEMCENPLIRKLSFTGSTQVGRILMRQCADTIKKLSLELGGNAPFIVYDDADIDAAVEGAIASKFRNAGQTCVCVNRFLVQENIHDRFVAALSERVSNFKVARGDEPGVDIGPLIDEKASLNVASLVESAVKAGAKVHTGGRLVEGQTAFYEPTVLSNITPEMDISQQEIFGPVATITKFQTEAESIALANDTIYGLASYFYSQNLGRVFRVMQGLQYGMVGVNEGIISTEVAPFGGVKQSGLGREGSKYGIDEYIEIKYCLIGGLQE